MDYIGRYVDEDSSEIGIPRKCQIIAGKSKREILPITLRIIDNSPGAGRKTRVQ